jgi:hypothetical protein
MIVNLSKAATLYLAPVLSLTSLILVLFAYTAPTILLHSRVALLVVSPSLQLADPSSSQEVDGPTLFLGALGNPYFLLSKPTKSSLFCDRVLFPSEQQGTSDMYTTHSVSGIRYVDMNWSHERH